MAVPASIQAETQTRSDSRTAYLDGVLDRPNLYLATGQTVTRILIGPGSVPGMIVPPLGYLQRAEGVEVSNMGMNPRKSR